MTKLILKVAGFTFLGIVVVLSSLVGVLTLTSPSSLASFFENIGYYNLSFDYYEKIYERDKSIDNLYMVLNKAIIFEDNIGVSKYFDIFYKNSSYLQYVNAIDAINLSPDNSNLQNVMLSNTDNRLKSRYVVAKAELGHFDLGFQFAVSDLYAHTPINNKVNFVLGSLISKFNNSNFNMLENSDYSQGGVTVAQKVYDFYLYLKQAYQDLSTSIDNYVKLGIYCNKLILTIDFITTVADGVENVNYSTANVQALEDYREILVSNYLTYVG